MKHHKSAAGYFSVTQLKKKKKKSLEIYLYSETDKVLAESSDFRRFKGKTYFIHFNYSLLIFSACMWSVKLLPQYLLT